MAITFIGAGAQSVSTTSGGTLTAAWPTGYTAVADDVAVLILAGRHNNGTSLQAPATLTGWTLVGTQFQEVGAYDLQITVWVRRLTTGLAAPAVTVPAAYSTTSGGLSAQVAVYRGVSTTTIEDAADVPASSAATTNWQPTGITTVTDNAWVLSIVASADDNALALGTANGFTARMSGANYDTTTGGDHAVGLADEEVLTPGPVTNPSWQQTSVASDAWVGITMALRPEPTNATTTPATISAVATLPEATATALNADATVTPATIDVVASLPALTAESWPNLIEVATGTTASNTTAGTSFTFSLGVDGAIYDRFVVFVALDNAGSQGSIPMVLDGSDITASSAEQFFQASSTANADPGTASSGVSILLIEGQNTGPSLAADTITLTFTATVTSKAAIVYRLRTSDLLNHGLLNGTSGDSTVEGGPATTFTNIISAPSSTNSTYYPQQVLFGATAIEANATMTGDSDTAAGTWSTLDQATANTGTSGTSIALAVQWKRITTESAGAQFLTTSWGTSADFAYITAVFNATSPSGPPRNVTATPVANGSTTLTWDPPADEGVHSVPLRYEFYSRPIGDPLPGTQLVDGGFTPISTTNTTYTWTGVTAPYLVNVLATTEAGSAFSADVTLAAAVALLGIWGYDARIGG